MLLMEFGLNSVHAGESVDKAVVAGLVNDVEVTIVELLDEVLLSFTWRCVVGIVCATVDANELDNSLRCPYGQHLYKKDGKNINV